MLKTSPSRISNTVAAYMLRYAEMEILARRIVQRYENDDEVAGVIAEMHALLEYAPCTRCARPVSQP